SLLCTDDFSGYRRLGRKYPHGVINHSEGKHVQHGVIGAIHTNTIDFGPLSNAESLEASIRSAESICRCTSRNFSSTIEKMQTSSERRSADAKARFASIGADACCSLFNRSCIIADCAPCSEYSGQQRDQKSSNNDNCAVREGVIVAGIERSSET